MQKENEAIQKSRQELNQLNSLQNLEQRIKNSDALIKTALNMVENTKQLLDSFIKLFTACLENNSEKGKKSDNGNRRQNTPGNCERRTQRTPELPDYHHCD